MWNLRGVKLRGKMAFKSNYVTCVLAALILSMVMGFTAGKAAKDSAEDWDDPSYTQQSTVTSLIVGGGLGSLLVTALVINPLTVGGYRFFLKNAETGHASLGEFLYAFKEGRWGNIVAVMFLTHLFNALWFLVLIVPGVVKIYSWRMVPYVLCDDPFLSPMEARVRSAELMRGQKARTFELDCSFLGWALLTICTLGLSGVLYSGPYYRSTHAEQYRSMTRGNFPPV